MASAVQLPVPQRHFFQQPPSHAFDNHAGGYQRPPIDGYGCNGVHRPASLNRDVHLRQQTYRMVPGNRQAVEPVPENLLRRKTPFGTIASSFDATPHDGSANARPSKQQFLAPPGQHNLPSGERALVPSRPAHVTSSRSYAAREQEALACQEIFNQAHAGLQKFGFGPPSRPDWPSLSSASALGMPGSFPQVDSAIGPVPLHLRSSQWSRALHPSLNGFEPPFQLPLGPTVSNEQAPYGPYWPNGAFIPYQPAPLQYDYTQGHEYHTGYHDGFSRPALYSHAQQPLHQSIAPPRMGFQQLPPLHYSQQALPCPPTDLHGNNKYQFDQEVVNQMHAGSRYHRSQWRAAGETRQSHAVIPNQSEFTGAHTELATPPDQVLSWAHNIYLDLVSSLQQLKSSNSSSNSNRQESKKATQTYTNIFPEPIGKSRQSSSGLLGGILVDSKPPSQAHQAGPSMASAQVASGYLLQRGMALGQNQMAQASLNSLDTQALQTNTAPSSDQDSRQSASHALDVLSRTCMNGKYPWIEGMLLTGCLAYALGDYHKALQWNMRILELDSKHVEAISNLAATHLNLNNRHDAEVYWRLAVKLRPTYFEALEHLVGLLCFDKRHGEAIEIIDSVQKLLRCNDNEVKYRMARYRIDAADNGRLMALLHAKGNILYNMKNHDDAAKAFEEVVLIAAKQHTGAIDLLIRSIIGVLSGHMEAGTHSEGGRSTTDDSLLLPPKYALHTARLCFPHDGSLPGLSNLKSTQSRKAAISVTSNSLLSLAKIFQDGMNPNAARAPAVKSQLKVADILALYYLSLSLQPSPSTANNVGILLASVQGTVSPRYRTESAEKVKFSGVTPGSGVHLALLYYQYGLNLDSRHAHLYTNLGSLLKDIGQLPLAIQMYERAVACDPNFDIALANLANAVKDQGKITDAIVYYRKAVEVNATFAEAVCGLANALNSVCDWAGRGGIFSRQDDFDRWHVDDKGGLVDSRLSSRQYSGWMQRVIEIVNTQLSDGESWGRGAIQAEYLTKTLSQLVGPLRIDLCTQRQMDEVKALVFSWLGRNWEGLRLVRFVERVSRMISRQWYLDKYIMRRERPTSTYARPQLPTTLPIPNAPTVLPFHTFTFPVNAKQVRLISQRNALRVSASTLRSSWMSPTVFPPPSPPSPCLNVGYVSSDFNNHPLAHLMQSVFGMHDRKRVKAFCYATTPSDNSAHRAQIEREAPVFHDVNTWPVERIVRQIVDDQIHILVNLNGYTRGARNEIFAARPAPVQMSFMGFAGTLGAEWCDYLLADETAVPQSTLRPYRRNVDLQDLAIDENYSDSPSADGSDAVSVDSPADKWVYSENIIFARSAFFCCDHRQGPFESSNEERLSWPDEQRRRWAARKELFPQLPDDAIIYGNFNQLYKIDPTTFRTWLRILSRVPNSYLWLLKFPADGCANLVRTARAWAGEAVASRILFTEVAPKQKHIFRACIADLFLDTPECNAHTTAADCLWSGTPLLTLKRYDWKMCSRMAAGILGGALPLSTNAGAAAWRELVAESEDEYENTAVRLGRGLRYPSSGSFDGVFAAESAHSASYESAHGASCENGAGRGGCGGAEPSGSRIMQLREMIWRHRWSNKLFDTQRWVRDLEAAYVEAWRRWVAGEGGDIWLEELLGRD